MNTTAVDRIYPDLVDPEDEELQKALQASMVTLREDEERRERLRSGFTGPRSATPTLRSSDFPEFSVVKQSFEAPEPLKKPIAPMFGTARPRPEPGRGGSIGKDSSDSVVPMLPKPVVKARPSRPQDYTTNTAVNCAILPPRPKIDGRDGADPVALALPLRPFVTRSITPDPSNKQPPVPARPPEQPISIPPRPVRSRPDLTIGPVSNQSVPPGKTELQGTKSDGSDADTLLIQLSPPSCLLKDFDVSALDPFGPRSVTSTSAPMIPPRPVGYPPTDAQRPVKPTTGPDPVFGRSVSAVGLASSWTTNPAYNTPWLPKSVPVTVTPVANDAKSHLTRNESAELTYATDDLMFFTESTDDPTYISLEDFDPLYSTDRRQNSVMSSGSYMKLVRPPARPTPSSDAVSQSGAAGTESKSRTSGYEELLDPFSLPDLTLMTQQLEKKRLSHEQEMRKMLLTVAEEAAKNDDRSGGVKERPASAVPKKAKGSSYEMLEEFCETADAEIEAFLQMVARIKLESDVNDPLSNAGYVISPRTKHILYYDLTIKVTVSGGFFPEPVLFTCDVNTVVEHMITHVLVMLNDDLGGNSADNYLLKVHGFSEYLINNSILADYEYVQQCMKLDKDIRFVLCESSEVSRPFKRHPEDDKHPVFVPKMRFADDHSSRVTRDKLNILMETFYKEVEKLRDATIQGVEKVHCKSVVQAVRAVCMILNDIETVEIMKAVNRLKGVLGNQPTTKSNSVSSSSPRVHDTFSLEDVNPGFSTMPLRSDNTARISDVLLDDLHIALDEVTKAVKAMIEMYCRTFHADFNFVSTKSNVREPRDASGLQESFIIHLATAHRIPQQWKQTHIEYRMKVTLYHGDRLVAGEILSQPKSLSTEGTQGSIIWDEWIQFDKVICSLPRETRIVFELIGIRLVQSGNSEGNMKVNVALGWVAMQLYNQQFELVQGSQLLGLWLSGNANPCGTNSSNSDGVLVQVNLPNFDFNYVFPPNQESLPSMKQDFETLDTVDQRRLHAIVEKDVLTTMTTEESSYLYDKRYHLQTKPKALPRFLESVPSWAASNLPRIYGMLKEWEPMQPLDGFQLLLPRFADTFVRDEAVKLLRGLSDDELSDLLPQLVQALKFEHYHINALAVLLLGCAQSNVRIAHQLYWLLKEAADSVQYRKRYQLMFGALLSVVGSGMREEFQKQEDLVKMLAAIADKVKSAKDKEAVLQTELHNMWEFIQHRSVRLPINPAVEVNGVDAKSCSFFTSFTSPLKLALKNVESQAGNVYTMFKAGDDLRQDMLTLQMIRIMDQLWMQDSLDLKMMTFRCQPTGLKRGLVELLMESDTLRKIQVKHGLTGSFKDRPIAEWLQVHNPTELDYQKAVENFTESCAGYCVATYILGICDRHNDNIMIKHSGHIFHIDFAKYLGDAQKFGSFKRDRTPFVLTSDMVYVINGGDKTSEKFQRFIDLCCRAFNIIRKHGNLLLTLFSLMTVSGIPGITPDAPRYIQKVLLTERSDSEAVADFTKMIQTSLESVFTQLNFFLHNLAQIKFFGHEEGALLSFIPKTYSMETDGKIRNLEMHGIQKRYSPEKYYIYIVKIERENQRVPSFVMRRYSEFQELHRKLEMTFPLVRFPSLSGKRVIGRAHVRPVAENRKAEIEAFMKELLRMASEVAQHDLIYTFFHPMLRDEQDISKSNLLKLKEPPAINDHLVNRRIEGSVKLNLFHKQDTLTIMVMHVKDLGKTLSGEVPSPYVKIYLLPDLLKETKRKTKVARNTFHPTYNEMLCYQMPLKQLQERTLQVTVWSYESLKENEFLGAAHIKLCELDLTRECPAWHKLQMLHILNSS